MNRRFALITGASGDIGSSIAGRFAEAGYSLYLHYYHNEKRAVALKEKLLQTAEAQQLIEIVNADFSVPEGVQHLLEQIHYPVDVIVHNSGVSYVGLVTDMADDEVQKMVQLHVTSPFLLTKYLLPKMISKKHGNILVISSVWGLSGASTEVLYSAVKGALNSLVKALAKEVAPSGITVNGIAPGAVSTKMLDYLTEEEKTALTDEIPMGRFAEPGEIADLAVFLASGKAAYINGEIVSMNGAWF